MNLDELGKEWRATNEVAATKEQREQLIAATRRRVERLWGRIFSRDVRRDKRSRGPDYLFLAGGAGCQPILVLNKQGSVVISKIGAGIVVCWALFVIYKLHRTRTIQEPASLDAPVREFCRIELDRLDRQIRLLRSILWWYIAPGMVGAQHFLCRSGRI